MLADTAATVASVATQALRMFSQQLQLVTEVDGIFVRNNSSLCMQSWIQCTFPENASSKLQGTAAAAYPACTTAKQRGSYCKCTNSRGSEKPASTCSAKSILCLPAPCGSLSQACMACVSLLSFPSFVKGWRCVSWQRMEIGMRRVSGRRKEQQARVARKLSATRFWEARPTPLKVKGLVPRSSKLYLEHTLHPGEVRLPTVRL